MATCVQCGAERPTELEFSTGRPPCAECGATGIAMGRSGAESIAFTDRVTVTMTPGRQDRGWQERWEHIQQNLAQLLTPHTTDMSGTGINTAREELLSFFVEAYHLKDALKTERPQSLNPQAVEDAINNDPDLALLTDLCNLNKHAVLNRSPRSGAVPQILSVSATAESPSGWRLIMNIEHAGRRDDGLEVARRTVAAWQQVLSGWGLV